MEVAAAAAAAAGAGVVELQLDLEAAAPTEREAKRRRVHPVPAGPPAVAAAAAAPGRRSRRRRVQRLFQACRHVFRGPGTVPSPGEVQLIRHMLGNMHRFTAIAPCAILDVLGPPYSIEEDRDCTYYADIPYTHHPSMAEGDDLNGVDEEPGQGRLAWLQEIDMPRELKMCSVHYGGPPISDK